VADSLQIIASGLLDALVSCDRGVTRRSSQVLTILVGDVLALTVLVRLRKSEVDNVHVVAGRLRATDEKVIRLDVAVNDTLFVNFLDAAKHLDADLKNGLKVELTLARLE